MLIGQLGRHASARSAIYEANLNQVRLDDFFDCIFLFVNRRGQGADAHRPALELFNNRCEKLSIHLVETVSINFHPIQRIIRDFVRDTSFVIDFGVVANASQQTVDDSRSAARPFRNLLRAALVNLNVQNTG